ncbi:hypothetical protein GV792_07760 [Nocardia cyriacigeorgica]|uniref:hypothetical protein n=1 Tax=Nocardia cyriacigeorgica TaxID=135487 RepID=UPI0013BC37A1|nr:hypothetical protein [Nocardia cyriacigeorgica]NEW49948.1 hypothetical protein [Nocardia cyriacigeorgica]
MADQLKHWQGLKQQAIGGEMTLERDVGEALARECETLLDNLRRRKQQAKALGSLAGYGGLPSANDIKGKFEKLATVEAVDRLDGLIEIAELMRDTYLASIGKLTEQDQQTSQALGNAGS